MTKAQIIDEIIAKKQEELAKAESKYSKVQTSRTDAHFSVIKKYFADEITEYVEDAYIKKPKYGGYESFEILRPHSEYSYDKECCTIRVETPWRKEETASMRVSSYSTSTGGAWELDRNIIVGRVALVIKDHMDDILAELDKVTQDFKNKFDKARDEKIKIENDIQSLRNEKNQSFLDIANKALHSKDGLTFDGKKKGSVEVRWDWNITGISNIKILRKTTSGKSADIEITQWDETPRKFENVRMHNVENVLWQYRDYVLTAE
jgi:hypothetical protein